MKSFSIIFLLTFSVCLCECDNKEKVAIYFSGPVRSIKKTVCSIKKYILEPLNQQGYEVHIFALIEINGNHSHIRVMNMVNMSRVHVRYVHPPKLPSKCLVEFKKKYVMPWYPGFNEELQTWTLLRLYYRSLCDKMKRSYEIKNKMEFKWGIYVRHDVVYVDYIPELKKLDPSKLHLMAWGAFGGWNDRFALGNSKLISIYMTQFDWLCRENGTNELYDGGISTEGILKYHLWSKKVPINFIKVWQHPFRFIRLRISNEFEIADTVHPLTDASDKRCLNWDAMQNRMWNNAIFLRDTCNDPNGPMIIDKENEIPPCVRNFTRTAGED